MVGSGIGEVATEFKTWLEALSCCPCHLAAGTPIEKPSETIVLFVGGRMKKYVGSIQGSPCIPFAPKPKTKYASSALIAVCELISGTTKTYPWIGPVTDPIP